MDLLADFERQFDGRRRHLVGNQPADGFIDRRSGDLLARGFATIGMARSQMWGAPRYPAVRRLLTNPIYAGAYVFGRTATRARVEGGREVVTPVWRADVRAGRF
ncbi:hypothetical protein EOA28_25925 [Mesorhizobium sp. M2A.F.Ca.ET.067.02.1.1]|nr:hypothetical protein EOA28_25925 [Mesorhizobium sp. M2A.F.Ca.ET.067.02.1.1]TIU55182.1 MAG: hypothetical protein E5W35_19265 [Mesorhizobium sp.]